MCNKLLFLLIALLLPACGSYEAEESAQWQVVSVQTRPELATEHLSGSSGCNAMRVRDIPATRTYRNGRTESYTISEVISLVDLCK